MSPGYLEKTCQVRGNVITLKVPPRRICNVIILLYHDFLLRIVEFVASIFKSNYYKANFVKDSNFKEKYTFKTQLELGFVLTKM